ncbi:MAG: PAS domain-containing protein, partial [Clostridiales bacterium]|nr:PAS domain-containing protein [Clostridiales bacterium]
GYRAEEFIVNPGLLISIIHPEDRPKVERHLRDVSNGEASSGPHEEDFRIIRRDGSERWIAHACQPVFAADGRHLGRRASNRDITDRKRAEEALRESEGALKQKKKMLEQLNSTLERRVQEEVTKNREKDIVLIQQNRQAALGEMLDHIAHQWKQPLNSIYLIIQDLKESWSWGELTNEDVEETVAKTMAIVDHMAQTIDVFRNFYRPEKEQVVFRLKKSIDSALSFMAPTLRLHGIVIEIDVDPDLSVNGYPNEYAQVLLNIITNARDTFKERKVDKPVLKIEAFAENDRAVVAITDNAGGIPESIIDKIFDLYFTTRESKDGSGIGLYMSNNIIEKNVGGKLSAANVDGGAQFRIELNISGC